MIESREEITPTGKPDLITILRYVMVVVFVVYIGILLGMKANSRTPFKTVALDFAKTVKQKSESLEKASSVDLKKLYGLNENDYKGVQLYYASSTMDVEEVLLVRTKEDGQMETVQSAVEKRLSNQKNNFDGYGTTQSKLLDNAIIEQKGDYLLFVISKDAEAYLSTFKKSL